jgi:hypothetical protein
MTEPNTPSPAPNAPVSLADLRFAVDTSEAPLAYPLGRWPDPTVTEVDVELIAHGALVTMTLPLDGARAWAGELFAAVSVAYREATGDPHTLTDDELSALPDSEGYDPGPGVLVRAGAEDAPALVRFHVAVDIQGACLSTPDLRAALVDHLGDRFNVSHVAVSAGDVIRGTEWSFGPPAD